MAPDGCLFHLGRQDFQVKVRGQRIEIGEVERALLAHPDVQEAAAVGRPTPAGDTQLVGYFVPAAGSSPTVTALRRHLADRLPDYMIPAAFVPLAALPSTPNGKLDYAALPDPDDGLRPDLATDYVAPQTELEHAITLAWQDVLGLGQVGARDNFFDLGGNSLLLAQLQGKLQVVVRKEIPMVEMFRHPTIDALVRYLVPATGAGAAIGPDRHGVESLRAGRNRLAQLAEHRQRAREADVVDAPRDVTRVGCPHRLRDRHRGHVRPLSRRRMISRRSGRTCVTASSRSRASPTRSWPRLEFRRPR